MTGVAIKSVSAAMICIENVNCHQAYLFKLVPASQLTRVFVCVLVVVTQGAVERGQMDGPHTL